MTEYIPPVSWYADRLRAIVLGKDPPEILGLPALTGILQHLEDLAKRSGERTIGAITADLRAAKDPALITYYRQELDKANDAAARRTWAV